MRGDAEDRARIERTRSDAALVKLSDLLHDAKVFGGKSLPREFFKLAARNDRRIAFARGQTLERRRRDVAVEARMLKHVRCVEPLALGLALEDHPAAEVVLSVGEQSNTFQVREPAHGRILRHHDGHAAHVGGIGRIGGLVRGELLGEALRLQVGEDPASAMKACTF